MRPRFRTALLVVALLGPAWLAPQHAAGQPGVARAELQAEFVERFTRFVDWPEPALPAGAPFVLCTLGAPEVGRHLARIAAEQSIKQRTAVVRATTDAAGCHVLFVAQAELVRQRELLVRLRDRPILTITEVDGPSRSAAVITLFLEKGRQRFSIDAAGAKARGLQVRSKLLRLARDTDRRAP